MLGSIGEDLAMRQTQSVWSPTRYVVPGVGDDTERILAGEPP